MAGDGVGAVVLAAGEGRRMGAGRNKALLPLGGRPMLAWSLALFDGAPEVGLVVLVVAEGERSTFERLIGEGAGRKVKEIVSGGATRQQSEWNGLGAARRWMGEDGIVLVHDAARPFAPAALLPALIGAAQEAGGAILATPASTGVVAAAAGVVTAFPSDLWAAQTPQAFVLRGILRAHEKARAAGFAATDTAAVYERYGGTVRVVEGSADNVKVTTPEDLALAEAIARRRPA